MPKGVRKRPICHISKLINSRRMAHEMWKKYCSFSKKEPWQGTKTVTHLTMSWIRRLDGLTILTKYSICQVTISSYFSRDVTVINLCYFYFHNGRLASGAWIVVLFKMELLDTEFTCQCGISAHFTAQCSPISQPLSVTIATLPGITHRKLPFSLPTVKLLHVVKVSLKWGTLYSHRHEVEM